MIDSAASHLIGATLPPTWPQDDLLDALPIQVAASPDQEPFGVWVMIERETQTVVGDLGFMGLPDDAVVELGFSVIPERRSRGYATEAVGAIVGWVHREPRVRGVIARCDLGNAPSIRVLERAGFIRTGESAGQIVWRHEAGYRELATPDPGGGASER